MSDGTLTVEQVLDALPDDRNERLDILTTKHDIYGHLAEAERAVLVSDMESFKSDIRELGELLRDTLDGSEVGDE